MPESEVSAKANVNKDTDGDGLPDIWETKGYDYDGDGKIDVDLKALGADPKKKDIFIAYAWMPKGPDEAKSHKPTPAILNAITKAFARAPVSNPNGTKGIKVHWKNLGSIPYKQNLNLTATNWAEFDAIMDRKVSPAERAIYHRMINGRQYDGGFSSGLARGIPASDFVETLHSSATTAQRAGTIMHELGHNLGLRHGGIDHENYKPNHLSIMSYANQFDWLIKNGQPYLDYERFVLQDLYENRLDEARGLTRKGGDRPIANYGVRWFTNGKGYFKGADANKNVNWSASGSATQKNVPVDINNSGTRTVLRAGYSEWDHIVYDGGQIGASANKAARKPIPLPPDALKELSLEEHQRMQRSIIEIK